MSWKLRRWAQALRRSVWCEREREREREIFLALAHQQHFHVLGSNEGSRLPNNEFAGFHIPTALGIFNSGSSEEVGRSCCIVRFRGKAGGCSFLPSASKAKSFFSKVCVHDTHTQTQTTTHLDTHTHACMHTHARPSHTLARTRARMHARANTQTPVSRRWSCSTAAFIRRTVA